MITIYSTLSRLPLRKNIEDQKRRYAEIVLIATGIGLRLFHFLNNRGLWGDEASLANNIVKYSVAELANPTLDNTQSAPYGFLATVKIITLLLGDSEPALRLFSLVCGIATIFLFHALLRRTLDARSTLFGLLLICIVPTAVYHSVEIKQYATEQMVAVGMLLLAVTLYARITVWNMLLLGMAGAVGLWFSFSSLFILSGIGLAWGVTLVLTKEWRKTLLSTIAFAFWLLSFSVIYYFFIAPNANVERFVATWETQFAPLPFSPQGLYWYFKTLLMLFESPIGINAQWLSLLMPVGTRYYVLSFSYLGFMLALAGVYYWYRKGLLYFLLLLSPLLFTWAASLLHKYPIHERFIFFAAPVFWLYIAGGAALLLGNRQRFPVLAYGVAAIILLYPAVSATLQLASRSYFAGGKFSQFREAIEYVRANKRASESVYFGWNAIRFYRYYDHRKNLNWNVIEGNYPGVGANSPESYRQSVRDEITRRIAGASRVWFVLQARAHGAYSDPTGRTVSLGMPEARVYEEVLRSEGTVLQRYTGYPVEAVLVDFSRPRPRVGQ